MISLSRSLFFPQPSQPCFLISLFNSWIPFSSSVYLSCSPVSLSFLCIFFHFFIKVVTSVSFSHLLQFLWSLAFSCFSASLIPILWLATVDNTLSQLSSATQCSVFIRYNRLTRHFKMLQAVRSRQLSGLCMHSAIYDRRFEPRQGRFFLSPLSNFFPIQFMTMFYLNHS